MPVGIKELVVVVASVGERRGFWLEGVLEGLVEGLELVTRLGLELGTWVGFLVITGVVLGRGVRGRITIGRLVGEGEQSFIIIIIPRARSRLKIFMIMHFRELLRRADSCLYVQF